MAVTNCHKLLAETLCLCRFLKNRELKLGKNKAGEADSSFINTVNATAGSANKDELIAGLNRLHTFNMKTADSDEKDPLTRNEPGFNTQEMNESTVCPSRTFYFEENVHVLEKLISTYEPILNEIVKKVGIYEDRLHKSEADPVPKTNLEGPALTRGKVDEMRKNKKFKIKPRSLLGLKSKSDWIFNVNIGNVMHLTPLCLQDLAISPQNAHEIYRDALYEKVIMLAISYFSLATECRFKHSEENGELERCESKYWHKAAVEFVCMFLPSDCPLVGHVVSSYERHNSLAQEIIIEGAAKEEEEIVHKPVAKEKKRPPSSLQTAFRYYIKVT